MMKNSSNQFPLMLNSCLNCHLFLSFIPNECIEAIALECGGFLHFNNNFNN
ncbi:MAG: hypothetical protein ACKVLD_06250 [Flavobacteriales bacterium]